MTTVEVSALYINEPFSKLWVLFYGFMIVVLLIFLHDHYYKVWFSGWDQTWIFKGVSSPQVAVVPDLFLTAVKLTHDKTGAQYLHAARDDSNNLFRLV